MPQEFNLEYGGALVNRAKFTDAKVAYPPTWTTIGQVVDDGAKLAVFDSSGAATTNGFLFLGTDSLPVLFLAGILQNGGDYWNDDHSALVFSTPAAHASISWMRDAIAKKAVDANALVWIAPTPSRTSSLAIPPSRTLAAGQSQLVNRSTPTSGNSIMSVFRLPWRVNPRLSPIPAGAW
jgi:ABC-type glycerol-3-phosphate transport system substrate-binding protein